MIPVEKQVSAFPSGSVWVAGIDEAGRGPVLGSMVYSICYAPLDNELKAIGVDDSKVLTPEKRSQLLEQLQASSSIGWRTKVLTASEISHNMFARHVTNLNQLAHAAIVELISHALEVCPAIQQIFIDTVGPPESLQRYLSNIFCGTRKSAPLEIVVAKKADSLYPTVSAASIIAKVTRDTSLLEASLQSNSQRGSGYPGDPLTVNWLKESLDPLFGYSIEAQVRFSWSTTRKLLEERGLSVSMQCQEEVEDPATTPKRAKSSFFCKDRTKSVKGDEQKRLLFSDKNIF